MFKAYHNVLQSYFVISLFFNILVASKNESDPGLSQCLTGFEKERGGEGGVITVTTTGNIYNEHFNRHCQVS